MHMPASVGPWRLFPRFAILALAVVIGVNALMISLALRSFPGAAGGLAFDTGNEYNDVLDAAASEADGRFTVVSRIEAGRLQVTPVIEGVSPNEIVLTGKALRPLGEPLETPLVFGRHDDIFEAERPLPALGQWLVLFAAKAGDRTYHTSGRVVVSD